MYIKSIVLDGFKSYGKRVEIFGFDTEFNAVTGLNGSGKSNILDSICFVLGISNLSQVRAGSLQDLIYKNGQAGVTKASVSIHFDNSNPLQCPPGYEDMKEIVISRQVIMGGKNKYWINGVVVPNKKVQDLFCSVQLNVNNPHFLIMQGRVTKVLNMKPQEILAMVEEAAGTRMYESKRQAAQKTIDKKQSKLEELNTILKEEISPKLEKLRRERQTYFEYQRLERELGHMKALYDVWVYIAMQRATLKAEQNLKVSEEKIQNIRNAIQSNVDSIDELTNDIMITQKETEEKTSQSMTETEEVVKEKQKVEAKAVAQEKSSKDNITSEEKKLKQLQKNLKEDEVALKNKQKEMSNVQNLFETLKNNCEGDAEAYVLSQKKFEAASAGMEVNEDGQAETLQEQLMHAKQEATAASTEMKTATMELKHCSNLLKEKQRDLGSNVTDYKKDLQNVQNLEKEVQSLNAGLAKINYSEERMNELQHQRRVLSGEVKHLRDKVDNFESRRSYTKFLYRDPEPNFNRNNVHGVVCKLFDVRNQVNCTALETAAGGRLYNVVVENDYTSKMLLQKGQLQNRTTFIPLNKIQGGKINDKVVKLAQDLVGKENVQPAISLISFDRKLQPAMDYIFGKVFIARDMDVARKITFNDRIRTKCVTLDGDVTDPGGTLSGGARQKGTPVLLQIKEIVEAEKILVEKEKQLFQIESEARKMMRDQEQYENLSQRLEMKSHEYEMGKQRLEMTTHHQQQQEVQQLQENIEKLTARYEECKTIEAKCNKKARELETTMKDITGYKERQLKQAESEMKAKKVAADKSKKEWEKREQEYDTLTLEISELQKTIEMAKQNITKLEETIEELRKVHEEHIEELKAIRADLAESQEELKEKKSALAAKNKEIQAKIQKQEKLKAQNSEYDLEIKKQSHEVKKLQDEYANMKAKEKDLKKTMSKKDESNLQEASKMSDHDGNDLKAKINKTEAERNKLSRTINTKAQSMYEHEEKQYAALLKRISVVQQDKDNLLKVMMDLDKRKKETIQLAFDQVKKDFGSIFGTLLPGADATLKAPDGKTILDGLEVKVSLGNVWKESLTELSGGQRSLVALSLILAMLLFKPAPLYILDEVDAALDLSHTQNIGNMLKSHFKQSQFIIVSLKDGMFNNANVLFRTKFIDGMSTVSRTVNKNR